MSDLSPLSMSRPSRSSEDPKRIGAWKLGRTIGQGNSGRVRLARNTRTKIKAAVKIISKTYLFSRFETSLDDAAHAELSIQREIIIMKLIDHPNIMRLYDVWETSTELYLILEYVQGGELFEYLSTSNGPLPPTEALGLFQQIIGAIDYCHRFNIAHRDLKPENILLDENGDIKIADFGMAIWQRQGDLLQTSCGSPHYAAPEVVSGSQYNGPSADIWSCGIILFALLTGTLPFHDDDTHSVLEMVIRGKFDMPQDIPVLAQDLLRRMLTKDTKRRITMPGIKAHPFFTSQTPKAPPVDMPSLAEIAHPIASRADIDPELLRSLCTLWSHDSEDLIASLLNGERNWQKGTYYLLAEYRRKSLEEYDEEAELARDARLHAKKMRKMQEDAEVITPSQSSLPKRDGPPTPRRARGLSSEISGSDASSPYIEASSPFSPPLPLRVPSHVDDDVQAFFHQIVDHLTVLHTRTSPNPGTETTKPLTIRAKKSKSQSNKENENDDDGYLVVSKTAPKRTRSKLRKRRASTSTPSSDPRRNWLTSVFKFKPQTCTLTSTHATHTTLSECRRLLIAMDVRVMLIDGVLRCHLEEAKDPLGMGALKGVRFRVEVSKSGEGERVELTLVQEKGSMGSFKEVCKRLVREWTLDWPGVGTPEVLVASPFPGPGGVYVGAL